MYRKSWKTEKMVSQAANENGYNLLIFALIKVSVDDYVCAKVRKNWLEENYAEEIYRIMKNTKKKNGQKLNSVEAEMQYSYKINGCTRIIGDVKHFFLSDYFAGICNISGPKLLEYCDDLAADRIKNKDKKQRRAGNTLQNF